MGDGRVEEYNGRRYMYLGCYHTIPAPVHESITVLVPDESVTSHSFRPTVVAPYEQRQPAQITETRTDLPPPVVAPQLRAVEPLPEQGSTAPARMANREITGGSGTRRDPFMITIQRDRVGGNSLGASEIEIPINFSTDAGTTVCRVNVTLSQLA